MTLSDAKVERIRSLDQLDIDRFYVTGADCELSRSVNGVRNGKKRQRNY